MKYDLLLADPPWSFKTRGKSTSGRTPDEHYPCLTHDQLIELGVLIEPMLKTNAALFLWCPYRSTPAALDVMEAWGFVFKTEAWVWVKKSKRDFHQIAMGLGYYTRNVSEICWLGVRGQMLVQDKGVPAYIESHRLEYSQKPTLQYEYIERLYPRRKFRNRLELFATPSGYGSRFAHHWDALGDEIDGKDIFEALLDMKDGKEKS